MWLPPAERQNELQFYCAKSWSYRKRLQVAFGLIAAGWVIEILLLNSRMWSVGAAVVLCGILLLLTKGYQNRPKRASSEESWRAVTRDEVRRIIDIDRNQKKWDQSALDITCPSGFFVLVGVAIIVAIVFFITIYFAQRLYLFVIVNAVIMLLPFWFTGVRSFLRNDSLIIKVKAFLELEKYYGRRADMGDTEFQFQLQTAKATNETGEVPTDVKAVLKFPEAPNDFLGVQMQVSLNNVQGTSYPYFYCVVVAKKEFGSFVRKQLPRTPKNIVQEFETTSDVHILIIRQRTTKNSGYHTNPKMIHTLFLCGVNHARSVLARKMSHVT